MPSRWLSLFLAFAVFSVQASVPISSVSKVTTFSNIVPGKYIVELSNPGALNGKRLYESPHAKVYAAMRKRGIEFDVEHEFNTPDVFVGATVALSFSQDVRNIAQISGVQAIRPVVYIAAPKPINRRTVSTGDSDLPDTESTHIMTGVDKVHGQGITGKGIKIGIIDTGIDYNHPALGGGIGPSFKVIGGYDFVGDNYDGTNTPVPDNDPLDECNGHGTHVAGIIGANADNSFNVNGVALDASIAAYRLFGCTGSVTDDIIIQALLKGYQDGMDILTLSLGGVSGWSESSSSVVASRLVDQGKVVTIAAGNDGALGSWYASSPGTGQHVISVASVDNTIIPVQNATVVGVQHDPIVYLSALPLPINGTLSVYATSTDTTITNDACDPLPDSTPDLSRSLVVVKRGTCTFVQKLTNIAAKGGKFFLVYNNGAAFSAITVGNFTAALISEGDGDFLVQQFAAKANISLSFPQTGASFNLPSPTGGLISSFSSYGPTYEMSFKPAVAAPGGSILSTYPLKLGGWALDSGTSMATPFTAGSAALVLQAKGKSASVARNMRELFETTAARVPSSNVDGDPIQTLSQAGAGLIQVDAAINTKTVVTPGEILLNDTTNFNPKHYLTITNTGSQSVIYRLSHVPAGTAASVQNGNPFAADGPVPLTTSYATVTLSQNTVTVPPGGSTTVVAFFHPPKDVDASTYPVYSGYIEIWNGAETLRSSYLGVVGSLKKKTVLDDTDFFFGVPLPALLDKDGHPQENATYSLSGEDAPYVLFRLVFGTPLIRLDLVDKDTTLQPTIQKRSWWSWWWPSKNHNTFNEVKTLGTLFEADYAPRNADTATAENNGWSVYALNGTLVDGTTIQDGQYKILIRALKVTGNPTREEDFESWLSPGFGIARG